MKNSIWGLKEEIKFVKVAHRKYEILYLQGNCAFKLKTYKPFEIKGVLILQLATKGYGEATARI